MGGPQDLEKGNPSSSSRSTIVDDGTEPPAASGEKKLEPHLATDSPLHGGEGESALPEDKRIELLERLDEDWQHDPDNPRNWLVYLKWVHLDAELTCCIGRWAGNGGWPVW